MDDIFDGSIVAGDAARFDDAPRRLGRPTLTNAQLLDKALEIFLEQGFDRTSVDAITAAAGMAKRTLYQRYGDKETLFKAALKRAIEEWIVPLETLRLAETDDLEETLLALGRLLVANLMSPAGIRLLRITNAESGRHPEIGAHTYRLGTEPTIIYLTDLLRRYLDPDDTGTQDWREAATGFLYLVVGGPPAMTAWGMTLDGETVERHTDYCVRLFLHGLLGASAAKRRSATAGSRVLDDENERLRSLLVDAMLENAKLREASAG